MYRTICIGTPLAVNLNISIGILYVGELGVGALMETLTRTIVVSILEST